MPKPPIDELNRFIDQLEEIRLLRTVPAMIPSSIGLQDINPDQLEKVINEINKIIQEQTRDNHQEDLASRVVKSIFAFEAKEMKKKKI